MKIIPLAVDSLVATPKQFGNRLNQIGITAGTAHVQKMFSTRSGHVQDTFRTGRKLRKILEI